MQPPRSAVPQPSVAGSTRSIPVPGRTARTSSAVNRPSPSLKSVIDVQASCSNGSSALAASRCRTGAEQKSRPSGLPCPPSRGGGRLPQTTSRGDTPAAERAAFNSLPSAKTRALSANASASSGLVPPGSGSKVVRPPSRSLSRSQGGGVKSGRRSAEPPQTRTGTGGDDLSRSTPSTGGVAGVSRESSSSTQPSDAGVASQASLRRAPSRLAAPRTSSAPKSQQSRKPIPTSIPTVGSRPSVSGETGSSRTAPELSTGSRSVPSPGPLVTAKASVAVVRQLSLDCEVPTPPGALAAAAGRSQRGGAENAVDDEVKVMQSEPSGRSTSRMPPYSSAAISTTANYTADQSAPSIAVAPCSDVTELPATSSPEVVDSALSVAPMQPMTSRAYMTSSGNPLMTSRLLSASQRPFTPLTGTWSGRQTLTNGYLSDGDVRPSSALHQSGYLSEGGASLRYTRRTCNLPGLGVMQHYLENVDDDEDR